MDIFGIIILIASIVTVLGIFFLSVWDLFFPEDWEDSEERDYV